MEPEPKGEPTTPDPSPTPEPDATTSVKPDTVTRFVAQLIDGLIAGGVFTVLIAGTGFSTIGYLLGLLPAKITPTIGQKLLIELLRMGNSTLNNG